MTKGQRIKAKREALGISQSDLAEKIGESKQTVYKYENGIVTNIPSDKIEAMARVLFTTPSYLMGWTEQIEQAEKKITGHTPSENAQALFNKMYADQTFWNAVVAFYYLDDADKEAIYSRIDALSEIEGKEKDPVSA